MKVGEPLLQMDRARHWRCPVRVQQDECLAVPLDEAVLRADGAVLRALE